MSCNDMAGMPVDGMMDDYSVQLAHLLLIGQSLGIGFLVGLERERHAHSIAGLRDRSSTRVPLASTWRIARRCSDITEACS